MKNKNAKKVPEMLIKSSKLKQLCIFHHKIVTILNRFYPRNNFFHDWCLHCCTLFAPLVLYRSYTSCKDVFKVNQKLRSHMQSKIFINFIFFSQVEKLDTRVLVQCSHVVLLYCSNIVLWYCSTVLLLYTCSVVLFHTFTHELSKIWEHDIID